MITDKEIRPIGHIVKPHGINGEVAATIDCNIDLADLRCIVLKIDGINVPFFLSSVRPRGSEAMLLTVDGIADERQANEICNLDIYALASDLRHDDDSDDDGFYISDLVGFTLKNSDGTTVGIIDDFDDSTANILLLVKNDREVTNYIPMAENLISDFDPENKTITLNLPAGILDL